MRTFVHVALLVFLCDFVSKELAAVLLGSSKSLEAASFGALHLGLVMNEGAAGGIWLGQYTRALNIASMAAAAIVAGAALKQLGNVHRVAPLALGLIVGGAVGNTVSLMLRPGVIDFLAFDIGDGSHLVVNIADIAALAGILALMPVGATLVSQIATTLRERGQQTSVREIAPVHGRSVFEREVPIALASEVSVEPEVRERIEVERTQRPGIALPDDRSLDANERRELR